MDFKTNVDEAIAMPDPDKAFELVEYALELIQQKQFSDYDSLALLLESFWDDIGDDLSETIEQTLNGVSGGTTGFFLGENPLDDSKFLTVLFRIAIETQELGLLCIVANNPYCPSDYLREIAKNQDWWEENSPAETVARNASCPEDLLRELSDYWFPNVRFEVAGNSSCPADVLEKLSHDIGLINYGYGGDFEESLVLFSVLSNPNCPIKILERISMGDFGDLRVDEGYLGGIDYIGGDEGLEEIKVVFRAQATKALALRS